MSLKKRLVINTWYICTVVIFTIWVVMTLLIGYIFIHELLIRLLLWIPVKTLTLGKGDTLSDFWSPKMAVVLPVTAEIYHVITVQVDQKFGTNLKVLSAQLL